MRQHRTEEELKVFRNVKGIVQTEKALLCLFSDGVERWVPRSTINKVSAVKNAFTSGALVVSEWFGKQLETSMDEPPETEESRAWDQLQLSLEK